MRYRNQKIILLTTIGFLVSFSFASAKNFTIYNATNVNQPYFSVDGTSGNVGIGLTNPTTPLQMLNNKWISAQNAAGTGVVNMFRVNANDQIEVGAPLNIGSFEFSPDSGLVTFVDMPVSSAPAAGTLEGYALKMDGDNMMTVYSEANGLGGIQNKRIGIGLANPAVALDVSGAFRNSLATTHSLLGAAGNVVVMADNTGTLYSTPLTTFTSANSLWGGTKNGNIWNGDAGVGNVGIGTTGPSAPLTVTKNGGFPTYGTLLLTNSNTTGTQGNEIRFQFDPTNTSYQTAIRSFASNYGNTNGGALQFLTGDAVGASTLQPRMTINESGNVGIGTTAPYGKLDIKLSGTSANNKYWYQTGSEVVSLTNALTGRSGAGLGVEVGTEHGYDGDLTFYTMYYTGLDVEYQWKERMRILANGNVGIGTTNPLTKLYTSGTAVAPSLSADNGIFGLLASNISTQLEIGSYVSSPYAFWIQTKDANNGTASYPLSLNPLGGNVGIGIADPVIKLDVSGSLRNSLATTHSLLGNAGNTVVMADNTGTLYNTPLSTFASTNSLWGGTKNGNIWNGDAGAGNVGVGTTAPEGKLHVVGIAPATPATSGTTQTGLILRFQGLGTNGILDIGNAGGGVSWLQSTDRSDLSQGYKLLLNPNGGNVGIGTTGPNALLEVNKATSGGVGGMITINNRATAAVNNSARLGFDLVGFDDNITTASIDALMTNTNGATKLLFNTYDGTNAPSGYTNYARMVIDSTGNVGIGTTNPLRKLVVSGPDDGNGQLRLMGTLDTVRWWDIGRESLSTGRFKINEYNSGTETERLTILMGGNIGIGLTNPGAALDISGSLRNSLATTHSLLGNAGNTVVMADNTGTLYNTPLSTFTSANSLWGGTKNGNIWNGDAGVGNVGIGTTGPNYKLDVNGTIGINADDTGKGIIAYSGSNQMFSLTRQPVTNNGTLSITSYSDMGFAANKPTASTAYDMIIQNGNVGIGTTNPFAKLEIAGALKFGDTADTCDANHTGALRYNSTSGQSYLCDGKRWINQKNCGLMTDDAGQTYGTVQVGGQCWMAENINIGTMLASGSTNPVTTDNIIQKWCYNNDPAQCAAQGGLYNWDEAMRGSQTAGARGICPGGWHIPSDLEYNKLEKTILGVIASPNAQYVCDFSVAGWQRCADNVNGDQGGTYGAGKSLKAIGQGSGIGAGDDLAGFNGKLSGYRNTDGNYYALGSILYLWSSTPNGSSYAWGRGLYTTYSTVSRYYDARAYGFSGRCLRD